MKKFFALLAVVLAVVSCQKDVDNLDVNVGGEQLVNITVGLPEETRAVSGTGFDLSKTNLEENDLELRYILEIYAKGNTTDCIRKEVFTTEKTVVFPVRLIHGRDYHVVAWADIVPAVANRTAGVNYDHHYDTSKGLTAVEIISWNAMDETRDAFTKFAEIENFSANRSLDLTLYRPFAKIRVVSTDIKDIEDLGFELGRGEVTYRYDMHRKFNAYTGIASDAALKGHTFTYPTPYEDDSYEDNTYETETQRTLFADYIFVDDVKNPDVVQFTMNVWDSNDVLIKETQFMTDIPVHANKLTTIIGEVLTEGGNVKVTIDNNLAEQEPVTVVSSASHLLKVINNGGEYILGNNIDVTAKDVAEAEGIITRSTGEANEPKTTTINLNGYTITLKADVEVKAGNTLIINNEPLNENGGDKGAVVNDNGAIVNNGTLVIEGGNYNEGAIVNNGTTNVNGGDFANGAINNNGNVTIEGENSDSSDKIVTDGNNATLNKVVYNADELQAALNAKNADEIIFGADIVGEATISQTEGVNVVINGNGHKFDGTLNIHGNARHTGEETLTIENINFEADAAKYFIDSNWTDTARRYAHNVTIQDCTFTSLAGDNSVAVCGIRFRQAYGVNINGCTATNTFFLAWMSSCYGVNIEGCEAINNYEGITVGTGNTSVIKNTNIEAVLYGIRVDPNANTHNVTIENCAFDAFIPVSARNLKSGKVNIALEGVNNFTRGGDYDIALCANEYKAGVIPTLPTGEWEITGANNYVVFPYQWAVADADELQNAINKANANVKINFTADIKSSEIITVSGKATIDGNGHTFTSTAGRAINVSGAEDVTIKNLTIAASGERAINVIQNSKKVTIENVTATAANYTVNVAGSAPNATVVINNSDLTGLNTVNIGAENTTVEITNTKITTDDKNDAENYDAISINKDGINSHVTVNGGEIVVKGGSDAAAVSSDNSVVTFNDTTGATNDDVVYNNFAVVYGDYNYTFTSFDAALDKAIEDNEEVTVVRSFSVSEPLVIEEGKSATIDLNGKTITGPNVAKDAEGNKIHVIINNGTLTLKNGTVTSTADNGGSAVMNKGTMTIENATLNGAPNAGSSWPSYAVNNIGVMTLENTTITSYHGAVASYGDDAVVTLKNCIIDMAGIPGFTSHGIYTYNNGKVIVNGGTYKNKATDQASSGASVINGAVEVNAGTFSGRIENYYGTPVLKGGTFSVNPNKNFIAPGYKVVEDNGTWTVTKE